MVEYSPNITYFLHIYIMAFLLLVPNFNKGIDNASLQGGICPTPVCQVPILVVNSLWPTDVIWLHGFRSKLSQAMACCLTAPRHYLNQCWLVISEVLWFNFRRKYFRHLSSKWVWNLLIWDCSQNPMGHWVNRDYLSLYRVCYGWWYISITNRSM